MSRLHSHKSDKVTAKLLNQIAYHIVKDGGHKVSDVIQKELLKDDDIKSLNQRLAELVDLHVIQKELDDLIKGKESAGTVFSRSDKIIHDQEREGIVIFILKDKYGVTHDRLSAVLVNKTMPDLSTKYTKIAAMKRETVKQRYLFSKIDCIINELNNDLNNS